MKGVPNIYFYSNVSLFVCVQILYMKQSLYLIKKKILSFSSFSLFISLLRGCCSLSILVVVYCAYMYVSHVRQRINRLVTK